MLEQDQLLKSKVNRNTLGRAHQFGKVFDRLEALHAPHILTASPTKPEAPNNTAAVAVMNYNPRTYAETGRINHKKLHSSQLVHKPELAFNLFMQH